jgi:thioredoxin reductase
VTPDLQVEVLVVGGGPAGLTAAAALAPRVSGTVLVLDRERQAGGIPRHSDHPGYGIRDLHRFLTGPAYARRLVRSAELAGARVAVESMVTGWVDPTSVAVTSPAGRYVVHARAVVLATGARERPRPARLVPGDRPAGVLTTGQLQNLVHVQRSAVGGVAVVVGAELVSWSAVLTLRHAGMRTVLMTTIHPVAESYRAFDLAGRAALRVPVATCTRVTEVIGKGRVRAVEVENLRTGHRRQIACDTVVFTGDWIPDNELARAAGLLMDPATRGPVVDTALRTSAPGVFAVGNLLHPVDTADIAALDGRHVADAVIGYLAGATGPAGGPRITVEAPLRWISPALLGAGDQRPARGRYLLWTDELIRVPRVEISQGGRVLAARVLPWPASPGRVFRVPGSLFGAVDQAGGEVTVTARPWRG